jgi:hypothetical protein
MSVRKRINGMVVLIAVVAGVLGGAMLLWTPPAEAKRCCYVMVCSTQPPVVCWEVCRTCPRLP